MADNVFPGVAEIYGDPEKGGVPLWRWGSHPLMTSPEGKVHWIIATMDECQAAIESGWKWTSYDEFKACWAFQGLPYFLGFQRRILRGGAELVIIRPLRGYFEFYAGD